MKYLSCLISRPEHSAKKNEPMTKLLEQIQKKFIEWKSKLIIWEEYLFDDDEFQSLKKIDLAECKIFEELVKIPYSELSLFMEAIVYYFRINLDYNILHRIRNDKYCFFLPPYIYNGFNEGYIHSVVLKTTRILNLREFSYLNLLKLDSSTRDLDTSENKELMLPYVFYNSFNHRTKNGYTTPGLENLSDWLMIIEPTLNSLQSFESEQSF